MHHQQTLPNGNTHEMPEPAPPAVVPTASEIAQQLQSVSWGEGRAILQEWEAAIRQQVLREIYASQLA